MAFEKVPNGFSEASMEDQDLFTQWMGWADDYLVEASQYANVYQAFCKD